MTVRARLTMVLSHLNALQDWSTEMGGRHLALPLRHARKRQHKSLVHYMCTHAHLLEHSSCQAKFPREGVWVVKIQPPLDARGTEALAEGACREGSRH